MLNLPCQLHQCHIPTGHTPPACYQVGVISPAPCTNMGEHDSTQEQQPRMQAITALTQGLQLESTGY